MICPKCGTNVDDRAGFCPVCGTKLQYQSMSPSGFHAPISQRSIPVSIILSIITCGIYMLYWEYCMVNDLNTACGETEDTSGGMVILLGIVTCGIYTLYWMYKAGGKVNKIHSMSGELQDNSLGILYLLLSIFSLAIVAVALIQNELNKVAGV